MMETLFALAIGWGVFWAMIWGGVFAIGLIPPTNDTAIGLSFLGVCASGIWIVAWLVVKALIP